MKPANIHIRALGQQVVEHAQHGGEADPGGDQHHGRVCHLLQEEVAGRRHDVDRVTDVKMIMQQVGGLTLVRA